MKSQFRRSSQGFNHHSNSMFCLYGSQFRRSSQGFNPKAIKKEELDILSQFRRSSQGFNQLKNHAVNIMP